MEQILSFTGRTSSWRTEITERVVDVSMVRENVVRNWTFGKKSVNWKILPYIPTWKTWKIRMAFDFSKLVHKLLTAISKIAEFYWVYKRRKSDFNSMYIEAKVGPISRENGTSFIVPRLFEEKRRDIVFGIPSFRPSFLPSVLPSVLPSFRPSVPLI